MEPSELLRHLASTLEAIGVPYFVTGSTASIAYGPFVHRGVGEDAGG